MDTLAPIVISSQSYNILNWEFWKKTANEEHGCKRRQTKIRSYK